MDTPGDVRQVQHAQTASAPTQALSWRWLPVAFLIVATPLFVWWVAFFPALSTQDSQYVWAEITSGEWKTHHPPPYVALAWLATRFTASPWVLSLAQNLLLALSLSVLAVALSRRLSAGWWPVAAAFLLVALPWVGPFAQEIWKDVLFTAAAVGLAAALVIGSGMGPGERAARLRTWTLSVFALALAVALLRWNGALAAGMAGVLAAPCPARRVRLRAVIACVAGGAIGLGVLMGLPRITPIQAMPTTWAHQVYYADLAVTAHRRPGHLTAQDRAALELVAPVGLWRRHGKDCFWVNPVWGRFLALQPPDVLERADPALMDAWKRLARRHPSDVLWARGCRASGVLPVVPNGKVFVPTTQQLLTPEATPPVPALHELAVRAVTWASTPPWLNVMFLPFWWFLAFVVTAGLFARDVGWRLLLLLLAVPAGVALSYVATAVSNDARYTLPATAVLLPATAALFGHALGRRRRPVGARTVDRGEGPAPVSGASPRPDSTGSPFDACVTGQTTS